MDFRSRVDSQPVASRYSSAVSYRSSPGRASPTRTTSPSRFISERAEALAASRSASASRRSSFDRSSSRDMGRYTSPGREAGSARYTSPGREAGGSTRYASPGRGIMSGRLGTGSPRRRTSMAGALGASPRVPRRDVGRGTAGDVRRWGVRDVGSWLARIDLAAFAQVRPHAATFKHTLTVTVVDGLWTVNLVSPLPCLLAPQAFEERGVDGGALLRMDMSDGEKSGAAHAFILWTVAVAPHTQNSFPCPQSSVKCRSARARLRHH
eukprot:SAG11_NODE_1248_length_5396_cov_2.091372_8_plen_266_part_00